MERFPNDSYLKGTSIFDPVLCEVIYRWFNIDEGLILDPFAGGSVRGIVAGYLGYPYFGIDLSEKQIQSNEEQAQKIETKIKPIWKIGNSLDIDKIANHVEADLIFSCPPYYNLEKYTDDPNDLSNLKTYSEFVDNYTKIVKKTVNLLKKDRFAVFVVSDIRDQNGFYRNFTSDTIAAFNEAGAFLYNEIVLINALNSLPLRAKNYFLKSRKVGKMHQNVLVFYKGDPKNIRNNFKELDLSNLEEILKFEEWEKENFT